MIQFTRFALLLGMAGGLTAQTLSFGEIQLVTPGTSTTAPKYSVNIVLSTANTQWATAPNQPAGFQFDLNYDPTSLTVTVGLGASSTAASGQLAFTPLLPECTGGVTTNCLNNPFCANPGQCVQPADVHPGLRAIVIGCCSTAQINNPPNGPNPPTSNIIADGVVATLTVQATSTTPASQTVTLMKNYMAGTTTGTTGSGSNIQNVGASLIPLTVPATGTKDSGGNLVLDMSQLYVVGDVYPYTSDNVGHFGVGSLNLTDAIQALFAVDGVANYVVPPNCTDRFDAMNSYPPDTPTTRGGKNSDGTQTIDLNDAITSLFRVDGVATFQGYAINNSPVRTSLNENGTCPAGTQTAQIEKPRLGGTLILGGAQPTGNGQERVPVYLRAGRDLPRLAFTFGLGDGESQLQFEAAPSMAPSIAETRIRGTIVAAWFSGLDAVGGREVLLGYVIGPTGVRAKLKFTGASATGLNDARLVGLDVSGAPLVER